MQILASGGGWHAVLVLQDTHVFRSVGFEILEHLHFDKKRARPLEGGDRGALGAPTGFRARALLGSIACAPGLATACIPRRKSSAGSVNAAPLSSVFWVVEVRAGDAQQELRRTRGNGAQRLSEKKALRTRDGTRCGCD